MDQKLKKRLGLSSLVLFATLVYKLIDFPGGMILSGLFIGGIMIVLILMGVTVLTGVIFIVAKKLDFWTVFFALTTISFCVFHYQIYSPTLKIIVPENYTGQVCLVKSTVPEDILTLDSNGIGYLNHRDFGDSYTKPIVVDTKGNDLSKQCVGFNPHTFYALGTSSGSDKSYKIISMSFDLVPEDKIGIKQYYNTDLMDLVDRNKIDTTVSK
tara:strand:+ start:2399 stop:3034 length:636 start_codon:yes stop_codon:yes gene_type:complete